MWFDGQVLNVMADWDKKENEFSCAQLHIEGEKEINYLKAKDKKLAAVIEKVGKINRIVDTDLFSSVVHHIIGQQISTKAQQTIWQRMIDTFGVVTAKSIGNASIDELQSLGMTFRKAEYIKDFSLKVINGEFDLAAVESMSDADAVAALASLKGIGVWTAEMILLFCLERPDIFSYDDLAIQRGLRMVYHHKKIDRKLFEKYRQRIVTFSTELEGLIPSYGDLISITHDMPHWGTGSEIISKNGSTLTLSEPVEFTEGQNHYVALRTRTGELSGPYLVTAGSLTTEVVLQETPGIDIDTGTDAERTYFAFGTQDKWGTLARVTGIKPRSGKVEITAVIEDNRVHAN